MKDAVLRRKKKKKVLILLVVVVVVEDEDDGEDDDGYEGEIVVVVVGGGIFVGVELNVESFVFVQGSLTLKLLSLYFVVVVVVVVVGFEASFSSFDHRLKFFEAEFDVVVVVVVEVVVVEKRALFGFEVGNDAAEDEPLVTRPHEVNVSDIVVVVESELEAVVVVVFAPGFF